MKLAIILLGKSILNDFLGIRTDAEELNYGFEHKKEHVSKSRLDKISKQSEKLIENYEESIQKINSARSYFKTNKKRKGKKVIFYCVCGEGMGHAIRTGVTQ